MKHLITIFIILLLAIGCGNENRRNSRDAISTKSASVSISDDAMNFDEELEYEPPRTMQPQAVPQKNEVKEKVVSKIIKDGSMTLEVDSLQLSKDYIDSIVKVSNAYYENEIFNGSGHQYRYTLKVRIPNSQFETFISSLEAGSGRIISKSIQARDVTGEYVDLQIRLDNNRAYLEQYRQLLKRANSMKDILEIQEKARRIESEIDAQLGRMKYINDQVKYSALTLEVYQKHIDRHVYKSPTFLARMGDSIKSGFYGLQEVLLLTVALWPFILIGISGFFLIRIYRKRKRS